MVSMSSLPNWLILLGISPMLGVVVIDLTSNTVKCLSYVLTHTDLGQWEALQLHAVSILRTASHVSVLQVTYQYCKSRISTTSHVSVLQVTYQYYKSRINTTSHVSVLQVTYQYYKSRISTTSHVSVLQVMQLRRIITYKTIKENSHWIHR